jgi:sulfane dehydrogenase subunit SoxC
MIAGSAALAGGLAARKSNADDAPLAVPAWMDEQGMPAGGKPYGVPSPYERNVIRRMTPPVPFPTAATTGTPLQDLHGIITPNGLHYERHHAGVPQIEPEHTGCWSTAW